jgi:tripartite-type tricarboxylate transporter receptor subunit TctC
MKLPRREFLRWSGSALALMAASPLRADTYPTRPLRWIVGFSAGGTADITARLFSVWLSSRLGQQVVVENKPGAGTNVATRAALDLPPDGYTLLLIGSSTVVNALLHERNQPTILQEIVPVAGITVSAFVIVVNSSARETTLAELIAFAKANPGKLRMGSYGIGTQSHLAAHLFNRSAGIDAVHVPYRGGAPLVSDLLGQHIQVAFDTVASSLPHIQSGALRALAVTTAERLDPALPDVPAAAEIVPGYEAVAWVGLGIRKGTPLEVVERLNHEVSAGLADPMIAARLADLSISPTRYGLDEFGAFWSAEVQRTLELIQKTGLKLE